MVQGVIFAGGYGKRLRPITDKIPKTLIEIKKNYTILDKQLLDFKHSGINEIFLLVGYKYSMIRKKYGENWNGLNIQYLIEKKPMGTLWALKNCSRYLEDDVIVKNGDTVSDFNLKEIINRGKYSNFEIIIALTKMRSPYAIVETENGRIKNFVEKPILEININAGLYYIKKSAFKYLNENYNAKEIEKTFIQRMVDLELAGAYFEDVKWFPIDNFKDLEEVKHEYIGRKDTDFGYVKNTRAGKEYYVKKNYTAKINANGTIALIKGKGTVQGIGEIREGVNFNANGKIIFQAMENSLLLKK